MKNAKLTNDPLKMPSSMLPISMYQKRFFLEWLIQPDDSSYNVSLVFKFNDTLKVSMLKKALAHYASENEVVHARYSSDGENCYYSNYTMDEFYEEINLFSESEVEPKLDFLIHRPFDLTKDILTKCYLLIVTESGTISYYLVLVAHHIIMDAEGAASFVKQIENNYNRLQSGNELLNGNVKSFTNAVLEEQRSLKKSDNTSKQKFWLDFIGDIPLAVDLPKQKQNILKKTKTEDGVFQFSLDSFQKKKLSSYARSNRATVFTVVSAVFGFLLFKYSRMSRFMLSYPMNMRPRNYRGVSGCFVNNMPMKFDFEGINTFEGLLLHLMNQRRAIKHYYTYSLTDIIQDQRTHNGLDHNNFFNVGVVQANLNQVPFNLEGVIASTVNTISETNSIYEIGLLYDEYSENDMKFKFEYNKDLFDKFFIQDFVSTFKRILINLINKEISQFKEIDLLSPEHYQTIIYDWNATDVKYSKGETLVSLFESQAVKTPNQIAVVFEDQQLTYQQLNQKSNQLAREIRNQYKDRQAETLSPETLIALCLDRSLEMVIAILGILKAGGAYVPIDPNYPQDRIDFILEDTKATLLLTQDHLAKERLSYLPKKQILLVDLGASFYKDTTPENLSIVIQPENLCYVIYTSGTTGMPKGVMVNNQNLMNVAFCWQKEYGLNTTTNLLQIASFSFDVSTGDICRTILLGGKLIISSTTQLMTPESLYQLINEHSITILESTPGLIIPLTDYIYDNNLDYSSLKLLILGSDVCDIKKITTLYDNFGKHIRILNSYGLTETTIDCSFYELKKSNNFENISSIPIGRPLNNYKTYVLDNYQKPVPIGVIGELYISGAGVAQGYLNREDLTRERFINNLFASEQDKQKGYTRMYKTGDLVRWLPDGNIEYIGRNDDQVKIRGYRIELQEIEVALSSIKDIAQSCVVVKEGVTDGGIHKHLVGYYVLTNDYNDIDSEDLSEKLSQKLPAYMIPDVLVEMETFPLTINGKLDKRSLPDSQFNATQSYVAPQTVLEKALCDIWASVIGLERVGVTDHFFKIGGNSILAMQLVHQINKELSIGIKASDIFQFPTIRQLPKCATRKESSTITKHSKHIGPLSFSQLRLWFIESYEGGTNVYHMPMIFELQEDFSLSSFENAIQAIVRRHEVLRSVIVRNDDQEWKQKVLEAPLHIIHRSCNQKEYDFQLKTDINRPFDLSAEFPIRICFYEVANKQKSNHYLLIMIHHIASDGWSVEILERELNHYYGGYISKKTSFELQDLPIQYSDYATWERSNLTGKILSEKLSYWREYLSGYENLQLPLDFTRPSQPDYKGSILEFRIPRSLSNAMRALVQMQGVTLYSALLSSVAVLLAKYSNQQDILIGSPHANRNHYQTGNLIGFFVNTVVNRIKLDINQSFTALIEAVHQDQINAQSYQDFPFEQLLDNLSIDRDFSRHPLFQVMFSLQNFSKSEDGHLIEHLRPVRMPEDNLVEKFDLSIFMDDTHEEIMVQISYATSLFASHTVQTMANQYLVLLKYLMTKPETSYLQNSLLDTTSYKKIICDWNTTDVEYSKEETIVSLFESKVTKIPNQVALVFEDQPLTYKQLNQKSNQLAREIRRRYEDQWGESLLPNTLIAICLDRGLEMVIGILGVLKAGACYVPIDPNYPRDRIDFILADTNTPLLLTQSGLSEGRLSYLSKKQILLVDLGASFYKKATPENLSIVIQPENLCYVIYTSGTTGKPKGVMIAHSSIYNTIISVNSLYDNHQSTTSFTSYVFDVSVSEIFCSLTSGLMLHILSDNLRKDFKALSQFINTYKIELLYVPPVVLGQLSKVTYTYLKTIIYAGEPCDANTLDYWTSKVDLYNFYGPTESSIYATCKKMTYTSSEIGKPIANMKTYVLDRFENPIAVGIIGELYISGAGVAQGYLNREDLTRERFINNPFASEQDKQKGYTRMYKTGDLVRWLPDGNIEYIGRNDDQVKIRGYRIELQEIEVALSSIKDIAQSCVVVKERVTDGGIHKYLVGYYVLTNDYNDIDSEDLSEKLSQKLPAYMIPDVFVEMETFPLTINGKLDKRSLPDPQFNATQSYVAPQTVLEKALCDIWASVIGLERVGVTDHFFKIGGNSILAMQLVYQINKALKSDIKVQVLFQFPTIQSLTKVLKKGAESYVSFGLIKLSSKSYSTQRETLFSVPGTGGTAASFFEMSRFLEEQYIIYGFDTFELVANSNMPDSIPLIAEQNITAMQAVNPSGPYRLCGYSFGAAVVYEMAIQLQRQGYEIASLYIIDGFPFRPEGKTIDITFTDILLEIVRSFYQNSSDQIVNYLTLEDLNNLSEIEQLNRVYELLSTHNSWINKSDFNRFVAASKRQIEMLNQYTPNYPDILTCFVHLFRINDANNNKDVPEDYGWQTVSNKNITINYIDGTHMNLLSPPGIKNIADIMMRK